MEAGPRFYASELATRDAALTTARQSETALPAPRPRSTTVPPRALAVGVVPIREHVAAHTQCGQGRQLLQPLIEAAVGRPFISRRSRQTVNGLCSTAVRSLSLRPSPLVADETGTTAEAGHHR